MFGFLKKDGGKIFAPIEGKCVRIEEVNDAVFSSRMMGDGFAVIPHGDTVAAPVSGEIIMVADTRHAIGIRNKKGEEILVHIGIDTVELKGEGFTCFVKQGDTVKSGEPLIRFDREFMEKKGMDMTIMVIFMSADAENIGVENYGRNVAAGEKLS